MENNTEIRETTATEQERTFTQDEVNKIVADRLFKERSKYDGFEEMKEKASKFDEMQEASKTELQKATERADKLQAELDFLNKANEVRTIREKVATDNGVPVSLLTGNTEEECTTQAKAILEFANKPMPYPSVKDGGEVNKTMKKNAVDQFADWFNAQTN